MPDTDPVPRPSGNLFAPLPPGPEGERFETLLAAPGLRIERIVSRGQASAEDFWYDQSDDEWVMLAQGEAELAFADGRRHAMRAGDWIMIPAHCRHRVAATSGDAVWLAVHLATG